MNIKFLIVIIATIFIMFGCATTNRHSPGDIGPCYGSITVPPDVYGCLFDSNYDHKPDIILFYVYRNETMRLISAMTIEEYDRLTGE